MPRLATSGYLIHPPLPPSNKFCLSFHGSLLISVPRPPLLLRISARPGLRLDESPIRSGAGGGQRCEASPSGSAMAAAVADPDPATSICAHCQREIPSSNIDLHSVHCVRNLQKCQHCGEMVPRKLIDEHYDENHAPLNCSLCKETIERESLNLHKSEMCPQRMVACEYCEFELPAVDLYEHQDVCGNRTEYCQTCRKYIRLREWVGHEIRCHINSNGSAGTSSARLIPEREVRPPQPVRLARPAHGSPHKRMLFTIAITGIAVMVASILFQRDDSFYL